MKNNVIVLPFVLLLAITGCTHRLGLTAGQEATVSPEAAAYIKKARNASVPSFVPIKEKQMIRARKKMNAQLAMGEEVVIKKYGITIERSTIASVPVLVITPPHIRPEFEHTIGFNIHGGGFVLGTASDKSALLLALEMGIKVYSVDYTLAPEAKYPVAINQCLDVYKELIGQFGPSRMVGVSSSSGGEIILCMLLKAQLEGLPLLKAQVCYTPAADISGDGDSGDANDGRDLVTKGMSVRMVKEFYLTGQSPRDSLVSPIYHTFPTGFPATVIVTGTRDLLESNGVRLFWKLKAAGVKTQLLVGEGMWHGFHWEVDMPEAKAARAAVVEFLETQLMP
jgi:monoterpene epsilon-lactone hydrolase